MLASGAAWAQPTDAEKETARSLMDDGDRLRNSQDLAGALQRYQAAHEIMKVPTTGIEVAKTQAALGQLVEARRTAIEVANLPAQDGEAQVMADARQEASDLAAQLATRIPSASIQIWPAEAQPIVVIDGVQLPPAATGLPYRTNPGEHVIQVSAPGYQAAEQRFTLQEGASSTVAVNLVPEATAVTPAAPPPPEPAPPPAEQPAPAETRDFTNAYIAFSIAGAGAVLGTVTGLLSLSKASDAKKNCEGNSCSSEAKDDIDSSKTMATFSNIGFGVAIAAGAWGLYEALSQPAASEAPAAASGPTTKVAFDVGPDRAGAMVWGAF